MTFFPKIQIVKKVNTENTVLKPCLLDRVNNSCSYYIYYFPDIRISSGMFASCDVFLLRYSKNGPNGNVQIGFRFSFKSIQSNRHFSRPTFRRILIFERQYSSFCSVFVVANRLIKRQAFKKSSVCGT